MQPQFKPPKTEEEFNKRAAEITKPGAQAVLKGLRQKRDAAVAALDLEIKFYEKVLENK